MADLEEIEAIKRLKYKYFRCLDRKLWKEMAGCLIPDAAASLAVCPVGGFALAG